MLIEYTSPWVGFELTALTITSPTCVVIGTDCIGSCKSNYHTLYDHEQRSIKHTHKTSSNTNLTKTVGALRCSGGVSSSCCMHKPNTCIFRTQKLLLMTQLMTFHEVNTRIDQPMEHDIHRDIRGEYHVPWVDQSLHSPNLKVINCFIIRH
jgi:hypothetical protein